MMFAVRSLALSIAIVMPTGGFADKSIFTMQLRLKQEGHYAGKADGTSGPMTRRAVQAYASEQDIEATTQAVVENMIERAREEQRELTDLQAGAAVEGIKNALNDPYSADIKTHFGYLTSRGIILVCGEVNAKNTYGAYTGFQWFNIPLMPSLSGSYRALSPDFAEDGALEYCMLGTSILANID